MNDAVPKIGTYKMLAAIHIVASAKGKLTGWFALRYLYSLRHANQLISLALIRRNLKTIRGEYSISDTCFRMMSHVHVHVA